MTIAEYLEKVADVKPSDIPDDEDKNCYYSKMDGSYLTRVGMEDSIEFMLKRRITEQIQSINGGKVACIGFSPDQNKWYGWSHRATFGFTIGSECKPGNCHFMPSNKKDFQQDCLRFHTSLEVKEGEYAYTEVDEATVNGQIGAMVTWVYTEKVVNKNLHGEEGGCFIPYPEQWGRGEWTAKTMEDAKLMAIDFAEGVG